MSVRASTSPIQRNRIDQRARADLDPVPRGGCPGSPPSRRSWWGRRGGVRSAVNPEWYADVAIDYRSHTGVTEVTLRQWVPWDAVRLPEANEPPAHRQTDWLARGAVSFDVYGKWGRARCA